MKSASESVSCSTPQKSLSSLAVARPAIAGADRIDEDEIGEVEPARVVVDQAGRGAEQLSLRGHLDGLGPDGAEMQIGRCRARTAIEDEGDRPLGVLRLAHIGDVEDVGERLPMHIVKGERAGLRAVGEVSRQADGVVGVEAAAGESAELARRRWLLVGFRSRRRLRVLGRRLAGAAAAWCFGAPICRASPASWAKATPGKTRSATSAPILSARQRRCKGSVTSFCSI